MYIEKPGSDIVRELYLKAYAGEITLSYSVWNIGEVLGAFNRARNIGRINNEVYNVIKRRFLLETRRMIKLGPIMIIPLKTRILRESWELIEKYHIYAADAIQVSSARYVNASQFLTGDKQLHEVAMEEKLNSIYLG